MRFSIAVLAGALILDGCAYKAEPISAAAYDTVTSYSRKIPGKYYLYVSAEPMNTIVRPNQTACSAHSFPIEAANGFKRSLRGTLANLVESIEEIPEPAAMDVLQTRGARGLIVVRAESLDGRLRVEPGFWSNSMATEVRISASASVDGPSGRLFGQSFEGVGKGDADAGLACSGGADSLRQSAERAMKEIVRKIGEAIANSERVRAGRAS